MMRPLRRVLRHALALGLTLSAASACARAQTAVAPVEFGTVALHSSAVQRQVTLTLQTAGTLGQARLLPSNTPDFAVTPSSNCRPGTSYPAGTTCTFTVEFAPGSPGAATAQLSLLSADGKPLAKSTLHGVGNGSVLAFTPGVLTEIALAPPQQAPISAIASDPAGNLFLAEKGSGQILRLDAITGKASVILSNTPAVVAMTTSVDGSLFILQANGAVQQIDAATGQVSALLLARAADGAPVVGIAATAQGTVLIATPTEILQLSDGAAHKIAGITTPFQSIRAIARDSTGKLIVADAIAARLYSVDLATGQSAVIAGTGEHCTSSCETGAPATSARLGTPLAVTTDRLGNVYLLEQENGLRRIDATGGAIHSILPASSSGLQLAALPDVSLALIPASGVPVRYALAASALSFAQTTVGQTSVDGAQSVLVSNLGNAPLTIVPPTSGTNPSTGVDFPLSDSQSCPQLSSSSSAGQLLPGQSCTVGVKFTPTTAGNLSSGVAFSSSDSGAGPGSNLRSAARNSIALAGVGIAAATQQANVAVISLPTTLVYGQPLSLLASVYSASGSGPTPTGTVTFTEGSTVLESAAPLSNGVATDTIILPAAGTHSYQASYSGDSTYTASQGTAAMVTVNKAASVFTVPTIPSYTLGQSIIFAFTLSGQYSGTGIALPSGTTSFQLIDSTGAVISTGGALRNDQVNSVGETVQPNTPPHGGTYTLRLIYPGDDNFLPLQRDYTITVKALDQTITFTPLPTPVTYGTGPFTLSASASSGLPVSFSVLSGPARIVNGQLVVTGVGTIVVAADQAGNSDYSPAPQVTQTVVSVRPVATINWPMPAPIYYGTPITGTQLNATATDTAGAPVAGTFVYTPAAGAVLPVGNNTLNVTFSPADAEHYGTTPITASVVLVVRDAVTPIITFNGGTVQYGAPLGTALAATATANGSTVPGNFVFTANGGVITPATILPVGTYTAVASFTPTDTIAFHSASASATITVVKSATALTLTTSASPVLVKTAVTFTASIAAGSVPPTGTIQFQTGSTILGSVPVAANGSASLTVSNLPAGTQTITALYSGDASYNAASATQPQVVADFTLALASSSKVEMVVLPAQTATWTLNVAPTVTSTLVGDVTLSITGLPTGATYKFTPVTVGGGSASAAVTLTVTAPTTLKAANEPHPFRSTAIGVVAAALVLPFARRMRRSGRRLRGSVLGLILFAVFATLSATGCGSGTGYFDQSQLSFPLTVTASSGAVSHATAVRLTVQ